MSLPALETPSGRDGRTPPIRKVFMDEKEVQWTTKDSFLGHDRGGTGTRRDRGRESSSRVEGFFHLLSSVVEPDDVPPVTL